MKLDSFAKREITFFQDMGKAAWELSQSYHSASGRAHFARMASAYYAKARKYLWLII